MCLLLLIIQTWTGQAQPDGFSAPRLSGEIIEEVRVTMGSPFLFDHWSPGNVTLRHGEQIVQQMLMYNGYTDDLYWFHPHTHQTIRVDKGLIMGFTLKDPATARVLVFENTALTGSGQRQPEQGFTQLLYAGSIRLMIRHRVRKTGSILERTPQGRTLRDQLTYSPEYMVVDGSGIAHPVKRFNRKTMMEIFPGHTDEVRQVYRGRLFVPRSDDQRLDLIEELDKLLIKKADQGRVD